MSKRKRSGLFEKARDKIAETSRCTCQRMTRFSRSELSLSRLCKTKRRQNDDTTDLVPLETIDNSDGFVEVNICSPERTIATTDQTVLQKPPRTLDGFLDVNMEVLTENEITILSDPVDLLLSHDCLKDSPAIIASETHDLGNISITNICSLGNEEDTRKSHKALFGLEVPEGTSELFVMDIDGRLHPVLTDPVLESVGGEVSKGASYSIHSVGSFNAILSTQFRQKKFSLPVPSILHLHRHVQSNSFPFCCLLEPQFFYLWKPVVFLPFSLKRIPPSSPTHHFVEKMETKLEQLLQQANVVSSIQSSSPSQVIVYLTDMEYFKAVTCFNDNDLVYESIECVRSHLIDKLNKLFEDKDNLSNSPKLIILDDLLLPQVDICNTVIDNSDQFSWQAFSFLVYLKAYSKKHQCPFMAISEFSQVATLFGISAEHCLRLLESLQSRQLLLLLKPDVIVIDMVWLFSSFGNLRQLSLRESPHLFNVDLENERHQFSPANPLDLLVRLLMDCHLLAAKQQSLFSMVFLPFHRRSNFCYNSNIGSLYLLTSLGLMPPGFFEKLIAKLWQSSLLLSLQKCECRLSAQFHMKLEKQGLGDYIVKLSNVQGYIKISLTSMYNRDIPYTILCDVASIIIKELKEQLKHLLPADAGMVNTVTAFFDCQDPRCPRSSGKFHLARVKMQHLECVQSNHKIKLNDLDESRSFWIAEIQNFKAKLEEYVFSKVTRPPSIISEDLDMSPPISMNHHIREYKVDPIVETFLTNHHVVILDRLDLECRNLLYQSCILKELKHLDAIALAEKDDQTKRSDAIGIILEVVCTAGVRGVMGLISAVKADRHEHGQDDNVILFNALTSDQTYQTIKKCWLKNILDQLLF